MEIEKLFNPKKTIFLGMNENGHIQARGRFFAELKPEEFENIKGCSLAGFKKKNLNDLAVLFPNLIQLTIEKTSNLTSLDGINKFSDLMRITIEVCPKLMDLSDLINCTRLTEVRLSSFNTSTDVLSFLHTSTVTSLAIHGNVTDLSKIIDFKGLGFLHLNGYGCELEILPPLPLVRNFNLEGFPKLNDGSFMANFESEMRLVWWGPKSIANIPDHLKHLDAFN
jgi:hypothetical protein